MEMVRMNSDLRLKKDVELSQTAYLKFHSVFNNYYTNLVLIASWQNVSTLSLTWGRYEVSFFFNS